MITNENYKKYFLLFSAFLISLFIFTNVKAQNGISPEKKKLIADLIVLTKADKQIVEITDAMLKSMEMTYPLTIKQIVERRTELSAPEKEMLAARLSNDFQSFSKRFRERLPEAVNYRQYIEQTIYPLYDKYFTEKELNDLVDFYKTETGQKVIDAIPLLFADSNRLARENLLPKVLKLVDELLEENLRNARQPPAPRKREK